jgi:hypothetical protein
MAGMTFIVSASAAASSRQVNTYGTTASVLCTFKELHVELGIQAENFWAQSRTADSGRRTLRGSIGAALARRAATPG